jgi:Predicted nucleotide-binding protein containing TIR-like domain
MTIESNRRLVFVIHGRNHEAKKAVNEFLSSLDLKVVEWEQAVRETGSASPDTFDVVKKGLEIAHAVVVIFTPDDIAQVNPNFLLDHDQEFERLPTGQARQNVILEAGMALAMKRSQTILLRIGAVREISDVKGINYVSFSENQSSRENFRSRLITAGCAIDDSLRFLTAGNFADVTKINSLPSSLIPPKSTAKLPNGIATLIQSFESLEFEWNSVKPQDVNKDHAEINDGKFILGKLKAVLAGHVADINGVSSEDQKAICSQIAKDLSGLQNFRMSIDGRASYRAFWTESDRVIKQLRDLIESIQRDTK